MAAELERAGERARQRGGWTAAAASFQRAAALTASPPARGRRLLRAAEASCGAGALRQAQLQLDQAAGDLAGPRDLAQVQRVRGRIYHAQHESAQATSALLTAAAGLGPGDLRLARDILVEAVVEAQINGQLAPDGTTRGDVARVARSLPLPGGTSATPGDLLLDADTTLQLQGLQAAAPLLRTAIDAVQTASPEAPETFQWLAAACADATILVDDIRLDGLARRMEDEARQHGAVLPLTLALSHAGVSNLLAGYLSEAQRCFVEHAAITEARGQRWSIGVLLVAAWRGQTQQVQTLLETVAEDAGREGQVTSWCSPTTPLRDRAGAESLRRGLRQLHRRRRGHVADQVRAARSDRSGPAVRPPRRRPGHAGPAGAAGRGQSVAADAGFPRPGPGTGAATARPSAPRSMPGGDRPARRGPRGGSPDRSQLVYGEWLRRIKRPRDARGPLRAAYRGFDEMGARAFAARARRELSAAGESVPVRSGAQDREALTAQEAQVAELAAGGATNAEIAAQLYLSPNTIDYHLRKVFRKLGVSSRRQLAATQLNPSS